MKQNQILVLVREYFIINLLSSVIIFFSRQKYKAAVYDYI